MRDRPVLMFIVIVTVLVAGVTLFSLTRTTTPDASGRPVIAATVFPLYDIVRNVAGDVADVRLVLPAGASPHTFDPSPSVVRSLADARTVYAIGHGLDGWISGMVPASAEVVTVDADIAVREVEDEDREEGGVGQEEDEDGHGDEGTDPHYWLDVANARIIARTVASDLSARFPDRANTIAENLEVYDASLADADREVRETLAGLSVRGLVTLHDAWYYFAKAYGLEIVASFEPSPGREPTPRYLAELGEAVREAGSRTIYSEPQLATSTLEPFARDQGLSIVILDPLGSATHASYIELMLDNARTIRDHQR